MNGINIDVESPVTAVAVVTSPYGVLLVQRQDRTPLWSFPGGTVEPGESPENAAARETLEETGLDVYTCGIIGDRRHPVTGRPMVYIAGTPVHSTSVHVADPMAITDVRWVRLDELDELLPEIFAPAAEYLRIQSSR